MVARDRSLEVAVAAAPSAVPEGGGVVVDAPRAHRQRRAEVGAGHAAGGGARPLDGREEEAAARDGAAVVGALALRLPHVDLQGQNQCHFC